MVPCNGLTRFTQCEFSFLALSLPGCPDREHAWEKIVTEDESIVSIPKIMSLGNGLELTVHLNVNNV